MYLFLGLAITIAVHKLPMQPVTNKRPNITVSGIAVIRSSRLDGKLSKFNSISLKADEF